jgi:hypothetical protein
LLREIGSSIWFGALDPDTVTQFVPSPVASELVYPSSRQRKTEANWAG